MNRGSGLESPPHKGVALRWYTSAEVSHQFLPLDGGGWVGMIADSSSTPSACPSRQGLTFTHT
jgi:hypothetical protein